MDPAIVVFGFGIGVLVGMTGMGGASLMTPLLILIFGVQPVTAIGTDIFYAAITKTVGGVQHLRAGTVHRGLAFWMACGSVPAAIGGVFVIEKLQDAYGEDRLEGIVFGILGATLLVVGVSTLIRTLFLPDVIKERFAMHLHRRHIIAAVATGVTTGFVIGLTSAGSGTLIAIILIAVFRLTPQRVVGTDIFHAAVLLWAAGIAHWIGGNVDFGLAGNILIGSIPGVLVGGRLALKSGKNLLRGLLSAVLIASGIVLITKGDGQVVVVTAALVSFFFGVVFTYILRREVKLPHGEGVRAYKLVSFPWSRPAHLNGGAAESSNGDQPKPTTPAIEPEKEPEPKP
ncbi:MAG: sulfite exporter TauE/SafE family protein [Solirubrobacterales bacterium]|nr:sulfite exporter TauE/SafE family protein [Solirubrobacterales bacterium]